ncbi:Uma2 family endonuclease [Methylobacterium sp. NEAU K]|uniref:Uma2 family endonuclease n=1 Tax=Methylobacterium sp. NEAU K TaxID=3064946 RepID=UPI002735D955|nr:Uma2 family endonuclease [Methylobacterium sp. NEAU K]MDP4006871.1 Uma2 family endonuclease [Methylobacterium sp. NEAU K]
MALAVKRDARMGVAEYRRWLEARPDEEPRELLDGEPVPRSPPREGHQAIVANLIRRIGDFADGTGWRAMPGLGIPSAARDDVAPVREVVVPSGPPLPDAHAEDPRRVAEVLSPSTMSLDGGLKIDFYRAVPSLRVLPIICSDEVWRRGADDWTMHAPGLDGAVPVRDIYRGLAI